MITLGLTCAGLLSAGLGVLWLFCTVPVDEDVADDPWWDYPQGNPVDDLRSSYPSWEDAMNHRVPGSYESSPRR